MAQSAKPFTGRWDINVTTPGGTRASWLGISEKGGALEVWYQPTGGNVFQVKDAKIEGSKLILPVMPARGDRPGLTWEVTAAAKDKLTITQKRGENTQEFTGVRAPDLKRAAPKAWTTPEPLFNGKDLTGWEPMGNPANSKWEVQDGMLVNTARGANLRTTKTFDDFKLHFEVNLPDHANSGMYLRGRYEIQLETEPAGTEPPERAIGSIYGRIPAKTQVPAKAGEWQVFDVTLVGRTVTIVRNGVLMTDKAEIEGITGGAIDANEGEPGPFYIQGDHAGGMKYRNVTISVPKK